jgi:hypothetical protein
MVVFPVENESGDSQENALTTPGCRLYLSDRTHSTGGRSMVKTKNENERAKCAHCKKGFTKTRKWQRFCKPKCRMAAFLAAQKAAVQNAFEGAEG